MTIVLSDWFAYAILASVALGFFKVIKNMITINKVNKELKNGSKNITE